MEDHVEVRKTERRKAEILRAAKKLFLTIGYEQTSVRQIVQEAETSMGNLYHHFPDKVSILKVIFKELVATLRDQIKQVHDMHLSPEMGFALDFRMGFLATLDDPKLSKLFLVVRNIPDIHEYSLENKRIRLRTFFGDRFSEEELNYLATAIQGIADSFFQQKRQGRLTEDSSIISDHIIDYSLRLLDFPRKRIEEVIAEVNQHIIEHNVKSDKYLRF